MKFQIWRTDQQGNQVQNVDQQPQSNDAKFNSLRLFLLARNSQNLLLDNQIFF